MMAPAPIAMAVRRIPVAATNIAPMRISCRRNSARKISGVTSGLAQRLLDSRIRFYRSGSAPPAVRSGGSSASSEFVIRTRSRI